jgi:hypothetical protein
LAIVKDDEAITLTISVSNVQNDRLLIGESEWTGDRGALRSKLEISPTVTLITSPPGQLFVDIILDGARSTEEERGNNTTRE